MRGVLFVAFLFGLTPVLAWDEPDKPNIVFILADDLGWRDLGCYGHPYHETPNIDRLAREGMKFDHAYANAPNCAPTRACLMSGQYTPRHGVYTVGNSARGKAEKRKLIPIQNRTVLPDETITIAEVLRSSGYATAHLGKWHLGDDARSQGFDVNVGGFRAGHPKSYFSPYRNPHLKDGPKGENLTDRLGTEAVALVEQWKDRPFFLYLSLYAVHTPIQGKPELTEKYLPKAGKKRRAAYGAMVETMDDAVGQVLAALKTHELEKKTVVFFFSDNGGHGQITSMAPLRGAKGMLYEGVVREPFIVRWPGKVAAGSTSATPVIGTDVFPTLMEIAGVKMKKTPVLDGVSLVPLLTGQGRLAPRDLFWHFPAYLQGNGKQGWRTTPAGSIRRGHYKLLEFFEDGRLELYHLAADPSETEDRAAQEPERVKELHARLKAWRESVEAPVPTEKNPRYRAP